MIRNFLKMSCTTILTSIIQTILIAIVCVMLFSIGCARKEYFSIDEKTGLTTIHRNVPFSLAESPLLVSLYSITDDRIIAAQYVETSDIHCSFKLKEGHSYLVVFRLYPNGLGELDSNDFTLTIDRSFSEKFSFNPEDYFFPVATLTFTCAWRPPEISQFTVVTNQLQEGKQNIQVRSDTPGYAIIGEKSIRRGVALAQGQKLQFPVFFKEPLLLQFQAHGFCEDPLRIVDIKKDEMIKKQLVIQHSLEKPEDRVLKKHRLENKKNEQSNGKTQQPQSSIVAVSFIDDKGKKHVEKQVVLTKNNQWHTSIIDLTDLSQKRGTLVFEVMKTDQTQVHSDFCVALTSFSFVRNNMKQSVGPHSSQNVDTRKSPEKNVVLISLDTVRSLAIGAYGNRAIKTPTIDYLAKQSTQFYNGFSQANLTLPSHTSMLLAVPPRQHGVYSNKTRLPHNADNVHRFFNQNGYVTVSAVSAYQLNGFATGFARDAAVSLYCPGIQRFAADTIHDVCQWLDQERGRVNRPFFLFLHLMDAHTNYEPPGVYSQFYYQGDPYGGHVDPLLKSKDFLKEPPFNTWYANWLKDVRDPDYVSAMYLGEISYADHYLAHLFRLLKKDGYWENMVCILTGDHGESLGEHEIYYDHWGMWQQNFTVPFLVFDSDRKPDLSEKTVQHIDITPTLISNAGFNLDREYIGINALSEEAESGTTTSTGFAARSLVLESSLNTAVAVVRDEWKFVLPLQKRRFYPDSEQLFNLSADPLEKQNLIDIHPDIALSMKEELTKWLNSQEKLEGAGEESQNESLQHKLHALGYLE